MLNLRCILIFCLVLGVTLTACATTSRRPSTPVVMIATFNATSDQKTNTTSQPNNTFNLTAEQAQEVAVFIEFIYAYNAGRLQAALAQLTENVGVSDCDYEKVKVVTFQGKSQVAEWLQQRISDHDQLQVSQIYNENPDLGSGRHVIGVVYSRRTSMTLSRLGFSDGITPTLASKVIFTSEPTLIESLANGPYGGATTFCRPGN